MADLIGKVGDSDVQRAVTDLLCRHRLPIEFAKWTAMAPWFPREFPVYELDGLPYVLCNGNDLIPYGEAIYHLQRDVYTPAMKEPEQIPGLYWPMLPEFAADHKDPRAPFFPEFIKHLSVYGRTLHERNPEMAEWAPNNDLVEMGKRFKTDYQSHFFGAKSKAISWHLTHTKSEVRSVMDQLDELTRQHLIDVQERFPKNSQNPITIDQEMQYWEMCKGLDNVLVVYAVDLEDGTIPCGMVNFTWFDSKTIDCDMIAVSHDPKYKPYSLVNCAILKAAYFAMMMRTGDYDPQTMKRVDEPIWQCNFGRTPIEATLYKAPYSHFEPIKGIQLKR